MAYRPEKLRVVYLIDEVGTAVLREVLIDKLFKYFLQTKEAKLKPLLSKSQINVVYPATTPLPSLEDLDQSTLEVILSRIIKEVLRDDDKEIKKMRSIMISYTKTATLQTFLNEKEAEFRKKLGKKDKQLQKLYPSTSANVKNFDVTSLCFLLASFVKQPDRKPNPNFIPEADDIQRIRKYRNEIVHHDIHGDFSDVWKDLKDAIIGLGGESFRTKIDDLQGMSLDKQMEAKYERVLKMWCHEEQERIETVKSIKENLDKHESVVVKEIKETKKTLSDDIVSGNIQIAHAVETAEENIIGNIYEVKGVMEKQQAETSSKIGKTLKEYQEHSEARLNSRLESYRNLLMTWSQKVQRGEKSGETMDNILKNLQRDVNQDIAGNIRHMEENVAKNLQTGMGELCEQITKHSLTKTEFQKSISNLEKRISEIDAIKEKLNLEFSERGKHEGKAIAYAQQRERAEEILMAEIDAIKQKLNLEFNEKESHEVTYAQQLERTEETLIAEVKVVKQKLDLEFNKRGKQGDKDAVPDNMSRWKWMVIAIIIAVCSVFLATYYRQAFTYAQQMERTENILMAEALAYAQQRERTEKILMADIDAIKQKLDLKFKKGKECFTNMDVIFLLDASLSVGDENFEKAKGFISDIVSFLDVNKENIQIGLVTFSDKQHVKFHLSDHQSSIDVRKAVLDITYDNGEQTFIGEALNFVRTHSFVRSKGARLNADKTLIILTDGVSHDDVQIPAKMLLDDGVVIVCIGIGKYTEAELLHIASDKTLVFNVKTFSDLHTIKEKVVKKVCSENKSS